MTPNLFKKYKEKCNTINEFYGILGFIDLSLGLYIVLIKKKSLVGIFEDHEIYRILEGEVIRIGKEEKPKNSQSSEDSSNFRVFELDSIKTNFERKKMKIIFKL